MKHPHLPYRGLPPSVAGSETSEEAAERITLRAPTLRTKVLVYIAQRGDDGATDHEVQAALRMDANTERPRRRELEQMGLIEKTERTRLTPSGRRAAVYVIGSGKDDTLPHLHERSEG